MNITAPPMCVLAGRLIRNAVRTVFTGRWYFAPDSIIIRDCWGPSAVTGQLCAFHSTFDLSLCLGLIYLAYICCHSRHPAVHTQPSLPSRLPPECHQLFPPSAAIVISLPSTGPLTRLGWHVPRLYLTRRKMKSWTNLWSLPLLMPLPPHALLLSDPSSSSAPPPPPPQHPAVVHLFSDTESYLFRCLLGRILALPPPHLHSLSVLLSTSFCQASNLPSPPPPPFFILPHPTRPVATAASLQFMGLLQQLPGRKKRQDLKNTMRQYGEEPCGEN